MAAVEKAIHRDLGRYRIRRRELFRIDVDTARRAIEAASGTITLAPLSRPTGHPVRRRWNYRRARTVALRCLLLGCMGIAAVLAFTSR